MCIDLIVSACHIKRDISLPPIIPHLAPCVHLHRFVVVCGDGEYIIYTAMALRNKSFGSAQEFVWCSTDASMYAVRELNNIIKIYRNFKEIKSFKPDFGADG